MDDIRESTSQKMAKSILQLREQGRAGEVSEEMMEQADPRTMAAYTPLDMSLDARMDRARRWVLTQTKKHITALSDYMKDFL